MSRRSILLACYEVPGWGGASTATYKLFEKLQADEMNVALVNIIGEHDSAYFRYRFGEDMGNPGKLDRVYNCQLSGNNYQYQPSLRELIDDLNPDLVVGIGWIAAYVLKTSAPSRRLIYITTGCGWMGTYADQKRGNDLQSVSQNELSNPKSVTSEDALEEAAIDLADLVVAHSDINLYLYKTLYRGYAGKMYNRVVWFSEWIYQEAQQYSALQQPFETRDIDVLFVANDWTRAVKGWRLAVEIIHRLRGLKVHIVGELPVLKEPPVTYHHHDFIADREALFRLMARTRVIVSPSSYDAAPGILFEAVAMGCNIVTSKNCGNWALCHPDLLVEPVSVKAFVDRIRRASTKPFASNIEYFNGKKSYDDLKNLLLVM